MAAVLVSGCASLSAAGVGADDRANATYRIVKGLDESLDGTLRQLSDTTAELVARVNSSNQATRRLLAAIEENQMRLQAIQRQIDQLTVTLYRQLDLSPPTRRSNVPATPAPTPRKMEVDSRRIIIEPPEGTPSPPPAVPQATPAVERPDPDECYHKAQELYQNDEFSAALAQFDKYLQLFPEGSLAGRAQYWKAHCRFRMEEYESAIKEFDVLRSQYPESGQIPYAMYNQAVAYSRLGQNARAEALFRQLIDAYPDDVAAERARGNLKQLQELR